MEEKYQEIVWATLCTASHPNTKTHCNLSGARLVDLGVLNEPYLVAGWNALLVISVNQFNNLQFRKWQIRQVHTNTHENAFHNSLQYAIYNSENGRLGKYIQMQLIRNAAYTALLQWRWQRSEPMGTKTMPISEKAPMTTKSVPDNKERKLITTWICSYISIKLFLNL
jgi:hypothetical protein